MRLDHPEIHTEAHRLNERELRRAAERRRAMAGRPAPLGRWAAALGSGLRALADRLDPATRVDPTTQLDRGAVT
jgi:hypothetical protein